MNPSTAIPGLIWMLAALTALAPLAIDAYLPAIPSMARSLNVSISEVELTLSLFLAGFGLGQLFGGPLSDHFGRRFAILSGLALFTLGTLAVLLSPSIEFIWAARFLQAFGGGISVVNSAAIVRDLYQGRESAQALSRIAAIMMAAPLLAPVLGSALLWISGWQGIFITLFIYALLLALTLWRFLPETRRASQQSRQSPLQRYFSILKHRRAMGFVCSVAFSYAGMFAFITGSAGVYMEHFGISPQLFPVLFGANVVTLLLCNQINIRLLHRYAPRLLLARAQWLQAALASVLTLGLLALDLPLLGVLPLIMLFIGLQGFIMSNGMAGTTEYFPHSAASATAFVGALGFSLGALSGTLVGLLGESSPLAMAWVMLGCVGCGLTLRLILHARQAI